MKYEHPYDEKRRLEGEQEIRASITIGDVAVCHGEPPGGNPYLASLIGPERARVLRGFRDKDVDVTDFYTLWYAPACGGARRIRTIEVDWSGLRA